MSVTVRLEDCSIVWIRRLRRLHAQAQSSFASTCDVEGLEAGLVPALDAGTHLLLADVA